MQKKDATLDHARIEKLKARLHGFIQIAIQTYSGIGVFGMDWLHTAWKITFHNVANLMMQHRVFNQFDAGVTKCAHGMTGVNVLQVDGVEAFKGVEQIQLATLLFGVMGKYSCGVSTPHAQLCKITLNTLFLKLFEVQYQAPQTGHITAVVFLIFSDKATVQRFELTMLLKLVFGIGLVLNKDVSVIAVAVFDQSKLKLANYFLNTLGKCFFGHRQ